MSARRLLIVDDEGGVRNAWSRALRSVGYAVWSAGSASDALRLCDEHAFDLVILDFIMPGMDGVELLARVRKKLPFVKSIVISGKMESTLDEKAIAQTLREAVEADAYLNKPVSNEDLRTAVGELLRQGQDAEWREIAGTIEKATGQRISRAKEAARRLKPGRSRGKKR